jgi:hypothetical protein
MLVGRSEGVESGFVVLKSYQHVREKLGVLEDLIGLW